LRASSVQERDLNNAAQRDRVPANVVENLKVDVFHHQISYGKECSLQYP
jgi:hypothetical protein